MITSPFPGERVAKRTLFLAYKHSRAIGRGILQEVRNATEDQVWQACVNATDYPAGSAALLGNKPGEAAADYVLGRQIKLELKWSDETFEARCWEPDVLWGGSFRSVDHLIETAMSSLRIET